MKREVALGALALGVMLAFTSAAMGGAATGPIPMVAQFRDNCRPTVSERDCLGGLPQSPDRIGGDFEGGYTDQVAGVESVIDREGNYHLHTNGYGPTSSRHLWLDLLEGSGTRPFVFNYARDASFTTGGTVPLLEMKVSTDKEPVPYVGTLAIEFEMTVATETLPGMLLFDQVTITRRDEGMWTITASGDKTVKVTDRERQVLGTYAMPFALTVQTLPGAPQKP